MKYIQLSIVAFLILCITGQPKASNKAYVTDTFNITLRTGPSDENRIIRFLSSGQAMDVIKTQGDWCKVKVSDKGEAENRGWVLKQYLVYRMPYKTQAEALMSENRELKERLTQANDQLNEIQRQKREILSLHQQGQKELSKIKNEFNSLKEESSKYLRIKAELESTKNMLESAEKRAEDLDTKNASKREIWFATGALVLLFGLLIGFLSGRQSRGKHKSLYY